ncbi:hypothetical protein [Rubrolithibacter danxiaensis]|uniref:hypothetical protein n=1 Tax=Rubrolithibacter danxiaensis TaxID=3390805 RepID=UPI003BF83D99
MKRKIYSSIFFLTLVGLTYIGCKEEAAVKPVDDASKLSSICTGKTAFAKVESSNVASVSNPLPYDISLLARKSNDDGTYTWIWSVQNPKPGNGKDGTSQDLSHWGISLGACASLKDIKSAGISTDGVNWKDFNPEYKEDKSQDCYKQPVLKFDAGTNGTKKTYYRLIVKKNFTIEKVKALYKSGSKTGCGTIEICGIGACPEGETPSCDDRKTLASDKGYHNVNSGTKEYYRGSTVLGWLNVNDGFDFCGSLVISNDLIVNSNGLCVVNGALQVNKNLTVNSNSKLKIKGSVHIVGNLILNSNSTIEFVGEGNSIQVSGKITKAPDAKIIGKYSGNL